MPKWKKGDPIAQPNRNPNMLEGIPSIATFIGKSYNTTLRWISHHGLPATKTPSGRWLSHKGLILQWMLAGNRAELEARAKYTFEKEEQERIANELGAGEAETL